MYLDPSAGSIMVQAMVGGVVAVGTVVKLYWSKIRSLGRRISGARERD